MSAPDKFRQHPVFSRMYLTAQDAVEWVVGPWRADQNSRAAGQTLVLGAGGGLDIPALARTAGPLTLLEPDDAFARYLRQHFPSHRLIRRPAEATGEPDATYDTVVSTLVLCSVSDLDGVLAEVYRVLKPGGQYLFLEHVANPRPAAQLVQTALDPLWRRIGGGCRLIRDVRQAIAASPLVLAEYEELRHGWVLPIVRGRAIRPDPGQSH